MLKDALDIQGHECNDIALSKAYLNLIKNRVILSLLFCMQLLF